MSTINGTNGDDTNLVGTDGNDTINGLAGDDRITGGKGADTIDAGTGNDVVYEGAGDVASGEKVDGGGGINTLEAAAGVDLSKITTIAGFETLQIDGDVKIAASQVANFGNFIGRYNNGYYLTAAAMGAYNFAGKNLNGLRFQGTTGADAITGTSNDDWLTGGGGADTINAGNGDDLVYVAAGSGQKLDGSIGADTLEAAAGVDLSKITTIAGFETLQIDGDVKIAASQVANFGNFIGRYNNGYYLTAAAMGAYNFAGKNLNGLRFQGTTGADAITGTSNDDWLTGGGGADTINAGNGDDLVYVAAGSGQKLDGSIGADTLEAAAGVDLSKITTIAGFETLQIDGDVKIAASQVANFGNFIGRYNNGYYLTAAAMGAYNFAGKNLNGLRFQGTTGADAITGTSNDDWLTGGGGADTINAGYGDDLVYVAAGSGQKLDGSIGADTLEAAAGVDLSKITTIAGFETLQIDGDVKIAASQVANFANFIGRYNNGYYLTAAATGAYNFAGKNLNGLRFQGATGADAITGTSYSDTIAGGDDDDRITGGKAADHITAGNGDDTVYLAAGDATSGETLDGGAGSDTIELGDNANLVPIGVTTTFEILKLDGDGTIAAAQLADFDRITTSGASTSHDLTGSGGGAYDFSAKAVDSLVHFLGSTTADTITGSSGGDFLGGGKGADIIKGGVGNDTLYVGEGEAVSTETLDGGTGTDTLELGDGADFSVEGATTSLEVLKLEGSATIGAGQFGGFSSFIGAGTEPGSVFNLYVTASGTYNFAGKTLDSRIHFHGGSGADAITGSSGDNVLSGGAGLDTIKAGDGDDTVFVAAGDAATGETIDGGVGDDTLELGGGANFASDSPTTNFETLKLDGAATIGLGQLTDFATIMGADVNGASVFNLTAAKGGTYSFDGKSVDSRVHFHGSLFDDTIIGSSAVNFLDGGLGVDTLNGRGGADVLTGGGGDDIFALTKGELAGDLITDFTGAGVAGGDLLQLSGYGSGATLTHGSGSAYTVHFGTSGVESLTIAANATLNTLDVKFV